MSVGSAAVRAIRRSLQGERSVGGVGREGATYLGGSDVGDEFSNAHMDEYDDVDSLECLAPNRDVSWSHH